MLNYFSNLSNKSYKNTREKNNMTQKNSQKRTDVNLSLDTRVDPKY